MPFVMDNMLFCCVIMPSNSSEQTWGDGLAWCKQQYAFFFFFNKLCTFLNLQIMAILDKRKLFFEIKEKDRIHLF